VLPNDAELTALAARAADRAREEGRDVAVVPTRSPVQGLAAIAVADPARRFGDDVIAMAEAAAATRWAEVTVAEQEALTSAGRCRPGDALGSPRATSWSSAPTSPRSPASCSTGCSRPAASWPRWSSARRPRSATPSARTSRPHPTIEVTRYDGGPSGIPLQVGVE
jgi:hypothetical protein